MAKSTALNQFFGFFSPKVTDLKRPEGNWCEIVAVPKGIYLGKVATLMVIVSERNRTHVLKGPVSVFQDPTDPSAYKRILSTLTWSWLQSRVKIMIPLAIELLIFL